MEQMTKQDHIISDLMDALEMIQRNAEKALAEESPNPFSQPRAVLAYISGVANGAQKRVNWERERNSDGYLVVKS